MEIGLGIIEKDGLYLILHRKLSDNKTFWGFPGGPPWYPDSCLSQTIENKLKDEHDLIVKPDKLLGITREFYETHYWLCDYVSGEVKINDFDTLEYKWASPDEINKLFQKALSPEIQEYFDSNQAKHTEQLL